MRIADRKGVPLRLVLAVFLGGCAIAPRPPPVPEVAATERWNEVQTEHLTVYTSLDRDAAIRRAIQLEEWRRAVLLVWGTDLDPAVRSEVILLSDGGQMRPYIGQLSLGGYYSSLEGSKVMVISAVDSGTSSVATIHKHELAHLTQDLVVPNLPRWLAEGIAEYLEGIAVRGDGSVSMPTREVREDELRAAVNLTLDDLWSWNGFDAHGPEGISARYMASFVLVTRMMHSHGPSFRAALARIGKGEDPRQVMTAFLDQASRSSPVPPPAFDKLPAISRETKFRPLRPAEVSLVHAKLWLHAVAFSGEERIARAKPFLSKAVELEPGVPGAEALGRIVFLGARSPSTETSATGARRPMAPDPRCPADIAAEAGLESASGTPPGAHRPALSAEAALGQPGLQLEGSFAQSVALRSGKAALVGGKLTDSYSAVLLREVKDGACVVNAWSTWLQGPGALAVDGHWVAKDLGRAVFLLKLSSAADTRFILLATDGNRLWPALKGPGGEMQLIAARAKLRPQSQKLYLDVRQPGAKTDAVFVLRTTGEFEQLR